MFKHLVSSDVVHIDAPAERVWDILTDVAGYGEWNPFTTRVVTDLEIGAPVDLHVTVGPWRLKQRQTIESVEPPRLLAWGTKMGHRLLLRTRREQRLDAVGTTRCRYLTTDAFAGILTPLVVVLFAKLIRNGFNAAALALKARAEATAASDPHD